MKKLISVLAILTLVATPVLAEEVATQAEQATEVDQAGAVFVLNKQPKTATHKQTVKVRRSGIILIVNLDGKVQAKKEDK